MAKKEASAVLTGLDLMGNWSIITVAGERIDGATKGAFENALIIKTDDGETAIIFMTYIAMLWERKSKEKQEETTEEQ